MPTFNPPYAMLDANLPYGTHNLVPQVIRAAGSPRRVRCYVQGCQHVLRTPTQFDRQGEICPVHEIRCHHSSNGSTYSFEDERRNMIAAPDLFQQNIIGHPFKYETHRFGLEKSEDALTWNVFRSFQEAGCLAMIGELLTGQSSAIEPHLYLWGLELTEDRFEPWPLLIAARRRFESNLPVVRPLTEPDIALHLPGRYLVLIEAKFTSRNTFYQPGPPQDSQSLTLQELLDIYDDGQLTILDRRRARAAPRVYYQLWRNTVFAEWMARSDHPRTKAFHVNLVREGSEQDSARRFRELVADGKQDHFRQVTWESLYRAIDDHRQLQTLRRYLETKTAGLKRAFQLP